jgi:hypothetical protein
MENIFDASTTGTSNYGACESRFCRIDSSRRKRNGTRCHGGQYSPGDGRIIAGRPLDKQNVAGRKPRCNEAVTAVGDGVRAAPAVYEGKANSNDGPPDGSHQP